MGNAEAWAIVGPGEASVRCAKSRLDESLIQVGRSEAILDQAASEADQAALAIELAESARELAESRLADLVGAADEAAMVRERAQLALEEAVSDRGEGRAHLAQAEGLRVVAGHRSERADVARAQAEVALDLARQENLEAQQLYDEACNERDGVAPDRAASLARQGAKSHRLVAQARLMSERAISMREVAAEMSSDRARGHSQQREAG